MISFLGLKTIAEFSKKKDISFNDLILIFFRFLPFIIVILLFSFVFAYINFLILKNNNIQNSQHFRFEIKIKNLSIISPDDSYFDDINKVLLQPINVKNLLRDLSITDLIQSSPELKDEYKLNEEIEINDNPKSHTVNISFSVLTNSSDLRKLNNYFTDYLMNFSFNELQKLFEHKIYQEQFQKNVLSRILENLKELTEGEELSRLARIMVELNELDTDQQQSYLSLIKEYINLVKELNPVIATQLTNKTLKIDILKDYLSRITSRDKNIIYFEKNFSNIVYNSISFKNLAIYYLIFSFLFSIFLIYLLLLVFYLKNNKN